MRVVLTDSGSANRLSEVSTVAPSSSLGHLPTIWLDSSKSFQEIEGFGGAFTEAAAVCWLSLSPEKRSDFIRDYFHAEHGHGYTFCRVHMNSCDFSLGNYSHVEQSGDVDLASFSIARDEQALIGVGAWILRRRSVRLAALIKRPPPATCPTNSTPITAIIFRRCGTSCVTGPNMNRDFATVAA